MCLIPAKRPLAGWSGRGGLLAGAIGFACLLAFAGCQQKEGEVSERQAAESAELGDDSAKAAYSLGYDFAELVERQFGSDIDVDAFVSGTRDRLTGADPQVDAEEADRVLNAMVEQRQAAAMAEASSNLDEGLAYLAENGKREEVVTLASGLQYEVLQAGEGARPTANDTVTTHYEGRLIDGTVFDSSYERGEPVTFSLGAVIPGWTEGLQLMSPGAKYRLYIPSELAYGDRSNQMIPANSTLIFEVELISIVAEDAEAPAAE